MRRFIIWVFTVLWFASTLTGCALPRVSAEERLFLPLSVDFLGSYTLTEKTFKETTVGGLSALTYDRQKDLYYAISDDRSDLNPARFYTLKLQVDAKPQLKQVEVKTVTTLKTEAGQPFAKGTIDAEGIALSPLKSVFISSEGAVREGVPPFIGEFDLQSGQLKRKLKLPESYLPDAPDATATRGIQDNAGFESLTLNAGAASAPPAEPFRLFAAVETPLVQDLEPPNSTESAKNRILHYLIEGKRATLLSEHVYPLEPKPNGAISHGLTEMFSIDQGGHFLSLERSFSSQGFSVKLFQVETGTASDVSLIQSLPRAKGLRSARKQLLLDLNQLKIPLDNLEGMTIGARLPDGSRSLILVSDDNFNPKQVTQFLLFRLKGLKG